MSDTILFIHGMFQNARSWDSWVTWFGARGYNCIAESWPFHQGTPSDLRANPPVGLGDLKLQTVIDHYADIIRARNIRPIAIGHSVGGLIVQKLAERDLIAAGVPIASVAPNRMLTFDWDFFRNSITITNPIKDNEIFEMTPEGFHKNFCNTMSREASDRAYEATATHDSRNVLRDCMLATGEIDLDRAHVPLLFVGAKEDAICPAELCEKNAKAYEDSGSVSDYREFQNRGHFICGQPGWEAVAEEIVEWLQETRVAREHVAMGSGR